MEEEISTTMDIFNGTMSTTMIDDNSSTPNSIDVTTPNSGPMLPNPLELDVRVQIGMYSVIFLLAVLGNVLVILTLVQNQGMRTITNLFLLNLAISDLLVGVFCMPFSLVGVVLKDFVFGAVLCKLIPYLQAVSVSVSAWTLVAISVERYYAICHPLTSRVWQTLSHAYKIICIVWILSLSCMSPIAFVSVLQPIRQTGRHKCREEWPHETLEKTYTLFLDIILLVLPLFIMIVNYSLITRTLWPASNSPETFTNESTTMLPAPGVEDGVSPSPSPSKTRLMASLSNSSQKSTPHGPSRLQSMSKISFRRSNSCASTRISKRNENNQSIDLTSTADTGVSKPRDTNSIKLNNASSYSPRVKFSSHSMQTIALRRCNVAKSLKRKKRVIQMLGVVVAEFFFCWTPLYVMNTWYLFSPTELYQMIGPLGVSLIHLLAYISSCCNPITLFCMSAVFRTAFCHVFGCHWASRTPPNQRNDSVRLTRTRTVCGPTYI